MFILIKVETILIKSIVIKILIIAFESNKKTVLFCIQHIITIVILRIIDFNVLKINLS
jgi:hypothetical protein